MPVFGIFAIGRFILRIATLLWRKEEIRGLLSVTLVTIIAGTWFYYRFEPTITNWMDAYFFTVITLTTIGYGDFSPTLPLTKLFTTIYVFIGLGIIAGLIGLVGEAIIEDANQRGGEIDIKSRKREKEGE
jgi:voltage-gated potassium channel Kch